MAIDTQQILTEAEKVGQLIAQHPAVTRYQAALKAANEDTDAQRLQTDFQRHLETLLRQEQSGIPVSDAQKQQLESLNSKIVSHLKIKALTLAQVELADLMWKIRQSLYKPLKDTPLPSPRAQFSGTQL